MPAVFWAATNYFTRYELDSGWFFPLPWDQWTFFVRGKAGLVTKRDGGELPAYEKFYLGGMNSVRGFEWGDISPKDDDTGDSIGGEKMALINVELIFPLFKDAGVMGVVFYDQGNVWTDEQDYDLSDMKQSVGAGIRYYSPFGPLRLEYGKVIDPLEGEPDGNWEFSIGTFF